MITPETLAAVRDRQSLFRLLQEHLHWALDPEDTYTYEGPELPDAAASRVDVSRIIPFTAEDPFLILLAEFRTPFRRTELREILRSIRREMRELGRYSGRSLEDIVFVCAEPGYTGLRFARFHEAEGRQPRLSSFGWTQDDVDSTRTLCEINLPALILHSNIFGEPDWKDARPRWLGAWDVERVTRDFFKEYRTVFEIVEGMVAGVEGDRRLFTQRLFNRLMFIHFLSKKGWLRFNGSTDYLRALYTSTISSNENFYRDRLYWVFFYGLGSLEVGAAAHGLQQLRERRGDVPYLNGGLFEMADRDDQQDAVQIPNSAFDQIINGLFARWNFTVSESTPLDVDVAIDPEMLGKVFEELVTGRHESGSYYTPRPVVSFMCREALKGYLAEAGRETPEALSSFVDEHDASGLADPEVVLERLRTVRVCDLACGSGAYLLGMLHELVDLRRCLFRSAKLDPTTDYRRKLEIIQNNLYGVDIDEFAVNVARLRLWLSLAVEYTGDTPQPLPNLDFKIERGDSLLAPDPLAEIGGGIDMFRMTDIREFAKLKADYGSPWFTGSKTELRKQIDTVRVRLTEELHGKNRVGGFDWWAEFAEVFLEAAGGKGGFDIMVANPPYVRQELIKDFKPTLKQLYPQVYTGTADLYCFFYARALQMLRPGGMIVFISSNKWFRVTYGAKLRAFISEFTHIRSITDFGDLPVFLGATAYPMIFVAQKTVAPAPFTYTQVTSLDSPYPDVLAITREMGQLLPFDILQRETWTFESNSYVSLTSASVMNLRTYSSSRVFRGLTTGFNEAFVIDDATRACLLNSDPNSVEIIKPLALGRDVSRWAIRSTRKWLILTKIGVDIQRYPAIYSHLQQWQKELETRWDKGNHWWELRACNYYDLFEQPKIVSTKVSIRPTFTFDDGGHYLGNTAYFIPVARSPLFILGVLNSKAFFAYAKQLFVEKQNGWYEIQPKGLENFPIPPASDQERATISTLVQKCLDAKGVGCEEWEREIDERVAGLYGL